MLVQLKIRRGDCCGLKRAVNIQMVAGITLRTQCGELTVTHVIEVIFVRVV